MFFQPNFCANCGEKIERADWGILTSRRFCPLCESEFKGYELIPRAIVGLGILAAVFGFGSYLRSGAADDRRVARVQQPAVAQPAEPSTRSSGSANSTAVPRSLAALPVTPQESPSKVEVQESAYFCGAETKKGTPCSRRVRGNVRCFQHAGMPAMLRAEKLKAN